MKNIKKFTALFLSLAMLFSMGACAEGEDENKLPSSDPPIGDPSGGGNTEDPSGGGNTEDPSGGGQTDPPKEELSETQKRVNEALGRLSAEDFTYAQLMGTDSLERKILPISGTEKKYVGIFYFVLAGEETHNRIYDNTKLLEQYGKNDSNPVFSKDAGEVSPMNWSHYWGEPLYGYYKASDRWVIRRHLELFMNAGIDFLFLDYSNGHLYPGPVAALLDVIREMQAEGFENVPTLAFLLPNDAKTNVSTGQLGSEDVLERLWNTYYSKPEYDSCWFRGDRSINKYLNPLVIGRFGGVKDETMLDELWLKELQWPLGMADSDSAFPWMEWNSVEKPQYNHGGIMNVSVAQHVNSWSSTSFLDALKVDAGSGKRMYSYRARGFDPSQPQFYGTDPQKVLEGTNFKWQWDNVLAQKDSVYMTTVTGWNEWVAPKVDYGRSQAVFNDAFNYEFSRDIEMMKGGYGDNYYMQLAGNIRAFKGMYTEGSDNVMLFPQAAAGSATDVSALPARFVDLGGDAVKRLDKAIDGVTDYRDESNRNNILETRVGNDGEYLYIAVTAKEDITPYAAGEDNWMTLYLDCGGKYGWERYNYVINRTPDLAAGETSVEEFTGSGSLTRAAGRAKISLSGKTVLYAIPLSVIGLSKGSVVGIKATDNLQSFGDVDDFYISGDCAPLGRLNYAYKIA